MAVDCPDNSTECLLRTLIETVATQQDPWSSRSFVVTVFIGVAAFLISVVTVFQGLLAAGPGRIKGSSNAIGNFSKLTKGRLSLIEFAWRSTARVPIITYDSLRNGLKVQTWFTRHGINYPFEAGSLSTGATWLHLLKCTGLDQEVETIFEYNLQPCETDHLPSDIQAPPASIQLSCLAILAAIADPSVEFDNTDRFIAVRGRISQISFRENPVLGTLAAYESYQTKTAKDLEIILQAGGLKPHASLGRCTIFALDLARGILNVIWKFGKTRKEDMEVLELMNAASSGGKCSVARWHMPHGVYPMITSAINYDFARCLALMVARSDYEIRPFPWKLSRLSVDWFIDATQKYLTSVDILSSYLASTGCNIESSSSGYPGRSWEKDMLFELYGTWIVPETSSLIEGDFGKTFCPDLFSACSEVKDWLESNKKIGLVSDVTDFVMNYDRAAQNVVWSLKHIDILLRRKRFQAMDVLDAMTRRFVDEQAAKEATIAQKSSSVSSSPIQSATALTPPQQSPQPQPAQLSTTPRSSISTSPSVGLQASLQHPGNSINNTSPQASHDALPVMKPQVTEEETLECLLTLRGFFYAALLKAGPDTSMLFEPDFKNAIVKII